jgi:DNA mismatch repair protein MSH2
LEAFELGNFMALPQSTVSSLGLFGMNPGSGSLFALLSKGCSGGPGERLLASLLRQPSLKVDELNGRLDCVEFFVESTATRKEIQQSILRGLADLGNAFLSLFPVWKLLLSAMILFPRSQYLSRF